MGPTLFFGEKKLGGADFWCSIPDEAHDLEFYHRRLAGPSRMVSMPIRNGTLGPVT